VALGSQTPRIGYRRSHKAHYCCISLVFKSDWFDGWTATFLHSVVVLMSLVHSICHCGRRFSSLFPPKRIVALAMAMAVTMAVIMATSMATSMAGLGWARLALLALLSHRWHVDKLELIHIYEVSLSMAGQQPLRRRRWVCQSWRYCHIGHPTKTPVLAIFFNSAVLPAPGEMPSLRPYPHVPITR
jgi:hypothetical protein